MSRRTGLSGRPLLLIAIIGSALPALVRGDGSGESQGEPKGSPYVPQSVTRIITRHFTPRDRVTGRYQYVPFDLPPGRSTLTISYTYDRAGGANVIDLGLFEPGPLELGRANFRGWSGGERQAVQIGRERATPGYWPGDLLPGRWHVLLGLYKISDAGVDVAIDIQPDGERVDASGAPETIAVTNERRSAPPGRAGDAWYRGDLHLHTRHSDGTLSAADLARAARGAGLDFIAITDHNNTVHQIERLPGDGPLVISGEEVTTPGGHANVWGLGPRGWVDFRARPADGTIDELERAAKAQGALFSINHPDATCDACGWTHALPAALDGIEVWNGQRGIQPTGIAWWDALLRSGRKVTAVGSSDWHGAPAPIGAASVRVHAAALSAPAILDAIRGGHVIVTADPRMPTPSFLARAGGAAAAVGGTLTVKGGSAISLEVANVDAGRVELLWNGTRVEERAIASPEPVRLERSVTRSGYFRAVIRGRDDEIAALTNPIWVVVK